MDVRFINPFIKSIRNIFQTMLSSETSFGKTYVREDEMDRPDVSGVIGFSGDASGAIILALHKASAIRIASQFAGTELELGDSDFTDAVGELVNMIAGGAKSEFRGLDVNISLPSVIIGEGHEITNSSVHQSLVIPCESPLGSFAVHVTMKSNIPAAVGAR